MKAGQSFKCLFWAMLYCVLYLVNASEDDLMDFDFSDLKEIDWNYDNAPVPSDNKALNSNNDNKLESNIVTFEDDFVEGEEKNLFDWRERLLRAALSRALTNRALRQKFVEVMPILRVLSSQQRLALSALISAQINAKKGHELRLDQVRMMFGDDKKLLIPIVYDIANMVKNSARKYLDIKYNFMEPQALQQTPIDRRQYNVKEDEADEDDKQIGVVDLSEKWASEDSLEDFMGEMPDDVIDPKEINAELQPTAPVIIKSIRNTSKPLSETRKRNRRSAEFVHKLIRSMPLSVNEDELIKGAAGRTMRLNTTSFAVPNDSSDQFPMQPTTSAPITIVTPENSGGSVNNITASYQEIEDLAFANLNGTATANDLTAEGAEQREVLNEPLPNPEELIAGPRHRVNSNKLRQSQRPKYATKRKRVQSRPRIGTKVPPPAAASPIIAPKKCERFTASMCLRTEDYPLEQIMGSIRRHKNAMSALLAEFHDNSHSFDLSEEFDDFQYNNKRREDEGGNGGGMCQSIVRFARPQKARSASGEWKYIVNTGQHTQTLRLEKCINPQESCSYLAQSYRSHCAQVYNYHRLLSWDKSRGLHVDIFKVPTCCSCQVDGYRQQFPPLDGIKPKDFTSTHNTDVYSTINEELDYNDEEDDDDLSYHYSNGFGQHRHATVGYDDNELLLGSSNKVRTKVYAPSATVGSYLSPPGGNDEFEPSYSYKTPRGGATKATHNSGYLTHRRPYKSLQANSVSNEARLDLEISPSETHLDKEVNQLSSGFVTADKTRAHQKRKRVFSVPHTATSTAAIATTPTHLGSISGISSSSSSISTSGSGNSGRISSPGDVISNSLPSSTATNAHQAPTVGSGSSNGIHSSGSNRIYQPKARFRSTGTFATGAPTAASSPTESVGITYRPFKSSSSIPSLYHVNSIFNAKYNTSSGPYKRINYSYHPIIDFFDSNKRASSPHLNAPITESSDIDEATFAATSPSLASSPPSSSSSSSAMHEQAIIYPTYNNIRTKYTDSAGIRNAYSTRERRIGYGANGVGGGGGSENGSGSGGVIGGISVGGSISAADNSWHPMIVNT